jgi:hypothetical protein
VADTEKEYKKMICQKKDCDKETVDNGLDLDLCEEHTDEFTDWVNSNYDDYGEDHAADRD